MSTAPSVTRGQPIAEMHALRSAVHDAAYELTAEQFGRENAIGTKSGWDIMIYFVH